MKNGKLKIGFVLDDGLDRPGGVQEYVLGLGKWLSSRGHEVHYLVGKTKRTDINRVHPLARNIRVIFNGNRLSIPLLSSARAIKKLLADNNFDILHVQVPYSPLMGGRIIHFASKKTAIVGTFHILPYGPLASVGATILGLFTRWQNKRFSLFLAVSDPARRFAKDKFKISSTIVPNFVDTALYKPAKRSSGGPIRLVFVGRLVERKGCGSLLKALAYAQEKSLLKRKISVDICGTGPEQKKLTRFCQENDLNDVRFHGFLSDKDKIRLLSNADVAVYPANSGESFGIVLLEAIAAGCTVLAGDNAGYRSVLGTVSPSLFDPADIVSFARLLAKTINDDGSRNDLKQRQQVLLENFDIETVGRQIESKYFKAKHDKLKGKVS